MTPLTWEKLESLGVTPDLLTFIEVANEFELVEACQEIGSVAESARWFTLGIAQRLAENGVRVDQLTVGELRCLVRDARAPRRTAWAPPKEGASIDPFERMVSVDPHSMHVSVAYREARGDTTARRVA